MRLHRTPASGGRPFRTVAGFQPATAVHGFRPLVAGQYLRSSAEPAPIDMVWHENLLRSVFNHHWSVTINQTQLAPQTSLPSSKVSPPAQHSTTIHNRIAEYLQSMGRQTTSPAPSSNPVNNPLQPPAGTLAPVIAMEWAQQKVSVTQQVHQHTGPTQALPTIEPRQASFRPVSLQTYSEKDSHHSMLRWRSTLETHSSTSLYTKAGLATTGSAMPGLELTLQSQRVLEQMRPDQRVTSQFTRSTGQSSQSTSTCFNVGFGSVASHVVLSPSTWQPVAMQQCAAPPSQPGGTGTTSVRPPAVGAGPAAQFANRTWQRFSRSDDASIALHVPNVATTVRAAAGTQPPMTGTSSGVGSPSRPESERITHQVIATVPPNTALSHSTMQQVIEQVVRTMDHRRWAERERQGGF